MRDIEANKILDTVIKPFVNIIIQNRPLTEIGRFTYIKDNWDKLETLINSYEFTDKTKVALSSKFKKIIDEGVQKN